MKHHIYFPLCAVLLIAAAAPAADADPAPGVPAMAPIPGCEAIAGTYTDGTDVYVIENDLITIIQGVANTDAKKGVRQTIAIEPLQVERSRLVYNVIVAKYAPTDTGVVVCKVSGTGRDATVVLWSRQEGGTLTKTIIPSISLSYDKNPLVPEVTVFKPYTPK